MKKQKHALVLFTKYPEPGLTKTRLMEENGGNLTAQEAADLYRAMCLDTATVALSAVERCRNSGNDWGTFTFYISSSPADCMPKIKALFKSEVSTQEINTSWIRAEISMSILTAAISSYLKWTMIR